MANNPHVNKVEYAGQTLMDLTGDTVTPSDVLNGVTFHDRSGASQTGSLITHNVYDGLDSSSASDALSANQGRILNSKFITTIHNPTVYNNRVTNGQSDPVKIYKSGNVCCISGYVTFNMTPTSSQTTIMELPSDAVPKKNMYATCIRNGDYAAFPLQVSTTGNINILNKGLVSSGDGFYIGMTYVI